MLTVNELMTIDPDVVTPRATLRDAVICMNQNGHRHLPVVLDDNQSNPRLVGILSERDIRLGVNSPLINASIVNRMDILDNFTVGDCMTSSPITVSIDFPVYQAANIFVLNKVGALPVVEEDEGGLPILRGILTTTDLLEQLALHPDAEPASLIG